MTDDQIDPPNEIAEGDEFTDEGVPAAEGILHCLLMLAEEATALGLPNTLKALHRAMAACAAEAAEARDDQAGLVEATRPATATLH